uniref:Apoptotic protease-activating factor 1 n=1 Tax=Astyanax mexicanus TaxID=7994 RepID=A0A8B9I1D4_ASTMX
MEERARSCLLRSKDTLEQDIKASYLMDHMISDGVLTTDEEDRVLSKPTRREQAAALLEVLLRKDNRAYISFYNALVRESYGDLANLLHNDLPQLSPEGEKSFSNGVSSLVQLILSEGGVPQRPMVFVNRPALLNQVREKLYQLQKVVGWVTVFGMAGSGKSVLAAEAVRDHSLIKECFPDGVHWLSVGQCERAELLVRMQSLCFRLEQNQTVDSPPRPPNSIEEAKERLRFLMLRKFPRALLILDDVWDSSSLRAFDIQCRVLLTTRNRSLTDSVSGQKESVPVESGLDEEKALEILALYVNAQLHSLPEQAHCIVKECKGSPLVVSLIGALLREFPDRWGYYLRQLQRKQFQRIRKSSSYDYEALDQAMDASLQVLNDEHRELYKDLSVLEKDVKVPAKVLSVLWDLELEEVEDVLQEFVNKSLLFRDCNQRPYMYFLHDLQLDFLTEQNRSQLQAYAKGPPTSADVEGLYWYRFLPHHMARAGLSKELYSLMFSLDWVKNKAQIMGSAHLINDYVEHGAILDQENSEVRLQFQEFLSLNGHQLEQRPFPDLVQLALSQPHCSEVYRQALLQAKERASRGQLYLDWVNKSDVESLSRLVLHPHQNSLYYSCFSRDGSKIASCGASKTLRVFKSNSGEKLQEIPAHDDEVLCCAFSPDDRHIATCSSDRKVKVSLPPRLLVCLFIPLHVCSCLFFSIHHLSLNPSLWNLNKRGSQNTMFGHLQPVNHCCFSPDDTYIATSSNDGSMKLFEVQSANEYKSFDISSLFSENDNNDDDKTGVIVKCSTWSSDGSRIFCAAKNTVFMFNVASEDMLLEIRTSRMSTVQYCHACPNSQLIALALSHYTVELWDFEANKKMAECSGHLSWIPCVQFSPNGSLLLSCSDDQTIRLWETERVHTSSAVALKRDFDVDFSQDGITVVAADSKNRLQVPRTNLTLCLLISYVPHRLLTYMSTYLKIANLNIVWDLSCGKKLQDLECHKGAVLSGDVSTDGSLFSTASADKTAKVWSCASWEMVFSLKGHKACVRSCRFSWDGKRLATGDDNGEIRVSDNGHLLKICSCERKDSMDSFHGGWVTDLHFSPDNKVLVSTGGYIKWWSVDRGEALQTFYTTGANLKRIHVSPDFRTFVTIDNIGILYVLKQVEGVQI